MPEGARPRVAGLGLARGPRPAALEDPPPAAWAGTPGEGASTADGALPADGGTSALTAGWWFSQPPERGMTGRDWRIILALSALTYAGVGFGVAIALFRGERRLHIETLLVMVGVVSVLVWSLLAVTTWGSIRGRRKRWRETAHSFKRVDVGSHEPSAVAAVVDHALRSLDAGFVTERPPPGAIVQWSHVVGQLQITFWSAVRGGLPLLEVQAMSHPETVAAAKARIDEALYGA